MGYAQTLSRTFTLFNNAGVAFTILSPLTALTGTYGSWGLLYGGPVLMAWGMVAVSAFSLCVCVCLAEMSSAYPTSGAIYYWSWVLAPGRCKAVLCWVSGWVLVLGQAAFIAANAAILVDLLGVFGVMGAGVALSALHSLLIFWAVLAACAAANSAPNAALAYLTSLGALWNVVALAALVAALPALARQRNSAQYLFTRWQDMTEFLGFDASPHMAEETHHADINAPRGMVLATAATAVGGFVYVLVLNSVALDARELLATDNESRGQHAVAQLFWNVHKAAYGDGRGGLALLSIPTLAALMCTYESIGANARMLFAFSRDGAVPFNKYIGRVEERTKAPVVAVWVMAGLAAVLGTPMFFSPPYVATVETMAVVNTYIAYGIPIACKLLSSRAAFLPGPYSMRPWLSRCLNALALLWIAFIAVVFSLPTLYPITPGNMNYNAAGTVLVLLLSLGGYYCPVVGGRHWFTGPRPSLGQFREDVAAEQQKAAAMAKHLMLQQELLLNAASKSAKHPQQRGQTEPAPAGAGDGAAVSRKSGSGGAAAGAGGASSAGGTGPGAARPGASAGGGPGGVPGVSRKEMYHVSGHNQRQPLLRSLIAEGLDEGLTEEEPEAEPAGAAAAGASGAGAAGAVAAQGGAAAVGAGPGAVAEATEGGGAAGSWDVAQAESARCGQVATAAAVAEELEPLGRGGVANGHVLEAASLLLPVRREGRCSSSSGAGLAGGAGGGTGRRRGGRAAGGGSSGEGVGR
ncbi:hypothetical protein CHLRE_07g348040v5 [Chlamydomonas reinhardtii]|uniref:Uncharacterized protein n=1 Tax=Chlamydomonas reinhardtii TaxID=3055 RepID=A0A2K3DL34_CHLRE|nr:uncharacterized protein CHLRE_07g348040v5 [Chlamydomonas reinhardtii]PNW81245.1 hypothetical protein CHLRE_07g348040v5 [Chlamydomonas reinhardtii]